ncbi:hypothetical protein [Joostella sp. CR20]|uniref:hypothetical protein n=1 Tax=Joostella sp. CR20 TaxID=2804312 RepID=UPI00313B71F5
MKNYLRISFSVCTLLLFSCKEKPAEKETIIELGDLNKETVVKALPTVECYQYIQGKDTISLNIETHDNLVSGTLAYKFFEKDKSFGTINGKLNGDILKADYTFKAEGTTSTREVIFMKSNDQLIPAYGETIEKEGKFVFKENSKLDFNSAQALQKVTCNL